MTTANIIHTKDQRLIDLAVADIENKVLNEIFNAILVARERLDHQFKWPRTTKKSAIRFFETFLLDCLDGIEEGVIINFPTPKPYSRPAVAVSRLWAEKYDRSSEAMFSDLVSKFTEHLSK